MPKPSPRPKYSQTHKKNIISESSIGKQKVEPGHIVRFRYGGKNVTSKKPLVLVLHPNFKGHLHGVNLDYISEGQLKQLWKMTTISLAGKIEKLTKLRLPLLKADIGNPQTFYKTRLRPFLKGKLGSTGVAYRTYSTSAIGGMKVIDYRFEGSAFAEDTRDKVEQQKKK